MDNEMVLEIKDLLQRLVYAVENLSSSPSWDTIIALFALIGSWIAIIFLFVERREKIVLILKYPLNWYVLLWLALY